MFCPLLSSLSKIKMTATALYARYSKEQLVQLLSTRDEEIASLKAMNREVSTRLAEVERSLNNFVDRFGALDVQDATIKEKLNDTEVHIHSLQSKVDGLTVQKQAFESRVLELERELEHELMWRRGFFPYLGLHLGTGSSEGMVEVLQTREPASASGIEKGDILVSVALSSHRRIQSIGDYQRVVSDLPPDANVTVELMRRGRRFVVQMQPTIGSYHR